MKPRTERNLTMMKLALIIAIMAIVAGLVSGCGSGCGSNVAASKTAPVTLSFKMASKTISATRAPLTAISTAYVKIAGPLMTDIEDTFAFSGSATISKSYQIPIGSDRVFYIEARGADGKVLYKGQKIQNVVEGSNSVTIDLYTTEEFAKINVGITVPNVPESLAPLYGACIGFYGADGNPNNNTPVSEDRIRDWLTKLKPYFTAIRIYSCQNGNDKACTIAKSLGYYVYAAAWISGNVAANEAEVKAAVAVANAGGCDVLIIGSEVLLRADLPAGNSASGAGFDTLIGCMKYAKEKVECLVTYDDIGAQIIANPDVVNECESVVLANLYPYWEGKAIEDAFESFKGSYNAVRAAVPSNLEVRVGETGWPTDGNAVGAAVPTGDNTRRYMTQVYAWTKISGVKVLWFEATDEAWKTANEGPQGAHWGVFDTNCVMKPYFKWVLY